MRTIEIDTDVFALIWAERRPLEETENEILKRVLEEKKVAGDVVTLSPQAKLEGKTSNPLLNIKHDRKEESMGKIRWVDDVRVALQSLGGHGTLHNIYKLVEKRRQEGNRSTPKTLEAIIRRTLEDHSSDSANFRGVDLFQLLGRGEWGVRKQ